MTVAQRFGQNLRRYRRVADLSQEQLGIRAGLHRTEIGLLERGARTPRIDTLLKLATGLDIALPHCWTASLGSRESRIPVASIFRARVKVPNAAPYARHLTRRRTR